MLKQILTCIGVAVLSLIVCGALVGYNVIGATAGAAIWLVCVAVAIVLLCVKRPKSGPPIG